MSTKLKQRPDNCRNALQERGESYPRSGCAVCGNGGIAGCPYDRQDAAALELKAKQLEAERDALSAHVERQSELLRRLVEAMRNYEMDVEPDFPPPRDHRAMMGDAETVLDATPETSLARLIAEKQAEALEEFLAKHGTPANRLREEVARLRRQAE